MALICHCRGVTERRIVKAVQRGAITPWEVAVECGAGSGCGGCVAAIEDLIDQHARPVVVVGGHMLGAHAR
jgi:bacterioferritin-associated ferredoxin